jgi:hypothetical protein
MGKRGSAPLSEEERKKRNQERLELIAKKNGVMIEWLRSKNVEVARMKTWIILAKSRGDKKPPQIFVYTDIDIASWYNDAAQHMVVSCVAFEEALGATWPTSRTEKLEEADPDEGMFRESAADEFAVVAPPAETINVDMAVDAAVAGVAAGADYQSTGRVTAILGDPDPAASQEPATPEPPVEFKLPTLATKPPAPPPVEAPPSPEVATQLENRVVSGLMTKPIDRKTFQCCHIGCDRDSFYEIEAKVGAGWFTMMCPLHWRTYLEPGFTVYEIDEKGRHLRELTEEEKADGT